MPKTTIRITVPNYGNDTVEVDYTTAGVHDDHRYNIGEMWQLYRGSRCAQLDVGAVIRMNSREEIEQKIVDATQGKLRKYLEEDSATHQKKTVRKINFKKQKAIPE